MSYYNDKYEDFFQKYSPERSQGCTSGDNGSRKRPNKKRRRHLKPGAKAFFAVTALALVALIIALSVSNCSGDDKPLDGTQSTPSEANVSTVGADTIPQTVRPVSAQYTVTLGSGIESNNAILVDTSDNTILARRNADVKIYPASMTKVMTLLVVAENVDDISKSFKMTSAIIDPLYREGATLAGFCPGEKVAIADMIYGMILESGAEASVGLAVYIAGSEENFVKMMNSKAKELGLTNTNFCNVTGLHDKNHYTTCTEMAMIMQAAINNDFCRQVLSTEYYTVSANSYHEEITFHSGMFSRMYGTEPEVATIKGGKTGYTVNSANCLVSYAVTDDNREIICVTADGGGKYVPIYDCIELYKNYTHPVKG